MGECKCKDPNPKAPHTCGSLVYKGDGNCDDDNNNKGCDFDGGDCCVKTVGGPVKTDYCNESSARTPRLRADRLITMVTVTATTTTTTKTVVTMAATAAPNLLAVQY